MIGEVSLLHRFAGSWHGAWLHVEGRWTGYRRYWKSAFSSASGLHSLLYLIVIGFGIGSQLRISPIIGVSYVHYIAPALLVSGALSIATIDSSFPVFSGFQERRDYFAVASTPITPGQLFGGQIIWLAIRALIASTSYALLALFFGAWLNAGVLIAILIAVFTGLVFAAPIMALAASTYTDHGRFIIVIRFVLMPMVLFTGTFFPIDQLPMAVRWLAWVSPLWHGAELARGATLGGLNLLPMFGHFVFLAGIFTVGAFVARKCFYRRLVV